MFNFLLLFTPDSGNIIQEYALKNKNLAFNDRWKENIIMLRHDSEVFIYE
mgnify:CR=1 FL=1